MGDKDKRPIYKPPRARDLSTSTVSGISQPKGLCVPGGALQYPGECFDGANPNNTRPGLCNPNGLSPQYGKCDVGHNAAQGCISGGTP